MRPFAVMTAVAMLAAPLAAATDANFGKMHFADSQERTTADYEGRTLAVFAFCKS